MSQSKLYIIIEGKKYYIEEKLVAKYGLKEGSLTPFTRLKIESEK